MALSTDIADGDASLSDAGAMFVGAADRDRAFARARRHSILVGVLRKALPLSGIAVCVLYGAAAVKTTGWGEHVPTAPPPPIDPVNLTMDNPHYEGFNKDGGKYIVRAETAQQDLSQLGVFKLNGITGEMNQADKTHTDLKAKWGTYDNKSSVLELYDGVHVASSNGLKAKLSRATIATKDGTVVTSEPVVVEMPSGVVTSNAMRLNQKTREITFTDTVRTQLTPQAKSSPQSPAAEAQSSRLFGNAKRGPIDIQSGRLDVNDTAKTALFTVDVKAQQGDSLLSTPEMRVSYEGQPAAAPAPADNGASPAPTPPTATKVRNILAKGPVVMTRGAGDQATADQLDFDAASEVAVLTGTVVLTQAPDRRVTSDRAELDSKADTALLTGAVNVTQGRNELHGRRLFVNHKSGQTQLTAPAEAGHGAGRITSRFYRSEANAAATAKKAATTPEASGDATLAFKSDPKAPIDIDAVSLNVDDHAKVAVYRGGVHAVQGDMTLTSNDLTIRYAGNTGMANGAKPDPAHAPAAGQQAGGAQLTRIEARGKVKIVSAKSGQTATGDWTDCDMKANTCLMGGDVLLTQAKNVVRGTRLKIDMTTGETQIINSPDEGWVAKAPPVAGAAPVAGAPVMKRDRPSALFYPKQMQDKAGAAPAPAAEPATSGWSSSTSPATPGPKKSGN